MLSICFSGHSEELLFFPWTGVSWISGWPWSHYIVEDDFKLVILVPHFPSARVRGMGLCAWFDWIQGFIHVRHALYQLSCISSCRSLTFCHLPSTDASFTLEAFSYCHLPNITQPSSLPPRNSTKALQKDWWENSSTSDTNRKGNLTNFLSTLSSKKSISVLLMRSGLGINMKEAAFH